MKKMLLTLCVVTGFFAGERSANAAIVDLRGTIWEKHSKGECGVDPYLMYAIALWESKQRAGGDWVAPSPWALNNSVYGAYYPTSYADAKQALIRYMKASPVTDIGIAQVNYKWNGHYVSKPEDLLDIETNIKVQVKILCAAIKNNPDDIELAIGSYNTPNPKLRDKSINYARNVLRVWKRLIEND
ncbi:transglycosylase SLT domain-containing protein [Xenorhabdus sp. KJ12.1]|uniref:transglycosylase SLT domain-containing protein n=1 Tax=Xenorhabdus sp. KJ12.1 TaxID=1851571 RepID=UPI000C04D32F|nr:transglycosylase SLT domain-containing protein [Xenorhabdus sp. KJ12.1]PHM72222.1 transglycosylase [Xenorhabdus sp. KJ12.1]